GVAVVCSSSRRHTGFPRDWSSGVCSSDLLVDAPAGREGGRLSQREVLAERELLAEADGGGVVAKELPLGGERLAKPTFAATRPRSEARRVGHGAACACRRACSGASAH